MDHRADWTLELAEALGWPAGVSAVNVIEQGDEFVCPADNERSWRAWVAEYADSDVELTAIWWTLAWAENYSRTEDDPGPPELWGIFASIDLADEDDDEEALDVLYAQLEERTDALYRNAAPACSLNRSTRRT
jgi:hypothetical protein